MSHNRRSPSNSNTKAFNSMYYLVVILAFILFVSFVYTPTIEAVVDPLAYLVSVLNGGIDLGGVQ